MAPGSSGNPSEIIYSRSRGRVDKGSGPGSGLRGQLHYVRRRRWSSGWRVGVIDVRWRRPRMVYETINDQTSPSLCTAWFCW